MFIMMKPAGLCIELIEAVSIGGDPDGSLAVVGDSVYIISAQAVAIGGIMPEYLKRNTVKAVNPVLGSQPEESFFVLYAAVKRIIGKTILYLVGPEIVTLCIGFMQKSGK